MKTIMVKNGKGGEGKTLVSLNIAALLAKKYKVLHIDTDPRCSSTNFWLRCIADEPTGTLGEWMVNKKDFEDIMLHTAYNNIDFIACSDDFNDYMSELEKNKFMNLGGTNLKNKLNTINDLYDYCIIDCSQNADTMAVNTFIASDLIIIPVCCSESSYSGLKEMLLWIDQIKTVVPNIKYRVLINDKEKNNEHKQIIEKIKATVGVNMIETYIRHQSKPISMSLRLGVPLVYMKRSKCEIERTTIVDDFEMFLKEVF